MVSLGALLFVATASTGSLLGGDGLTVPSEVDPIVGGELTDPREFDGVVAILAGQGLCTGTVVAPRLVLTAAHCLAELRAGQNVTVYYGNEIDPNQSVTASSYGAHPDFCPDCDEDIYDYGYVVIDADFTVPGGYLLPIVDQDEWDSVMVTGNDVTVVGYGEDPDVSGDKGIGVKRKVTTQIRDFSDEGLEFFAGGEQRDSCAGDSGGPAFVELEDGTWRLAGITSRGSSPCGDGGYYGIPYAALCWVREETGVDLLGDAACESCDCLATKPANADKCSIDPTRRDGTSLLWILGAMLVARIRRGRA